MAARVQAHQTVVAVVAAPAAMEGLTPMNLVAAAEALSRVQPVAAAPSPAVVTGGRKLRVFLPMPRRRRGWWCRQRAGVTAFAAHRH